MRVNMTNGAKKISLRKAACLGLMVLGLMTSLCAQDYLVKDNTSSGVRTLVWIPLEVTAWEAGLANGYQVKRWKEGEGEPSAVVIASGIRPKEAAWFEGHRFDQGGLVEVMGALLSDSAYTRQSKKFDGPAIRYNYLVYEANRDSKIAQILGLSFVDSTAQPGTRYTYKITAGEKHASITTSKEDTYRQTSPGVSLPEFTFPEGRSLYSMVPKSNKPIGKVAAAARAYGDSIVVKWAPNSYEYWQYSKAEGFVVKKYEVDTLDPGNFTLLDSFAINSIPQTELDPSIEADSNALVAANLLYGENMDMSHLSTIDQAHFQENQFTLGLLSANNSLLAGKILGWNLIDKNVEKGKVYNYLVSTKAPAAFYSTSIVEVKNVYVPLEAPKGLYIESGEKKVEVVWDKEGNQNRFSLYELYRSDDGGQTYRRLGGPIAFLENEKYPFQEYAKRDSLEVNYQPYHYRLVGINSFGERSLPAEAIGMGVDLTPPRKPVIVNGALSPSEDTLKINWSIPGGAPEDFDRFEVVLGEQPDGDYVTLGEFSAETKWLDYYPGAPQKASERTYYFRVIAFDTAGNQSLSDPRFVHYPDLFAPEPPENLTASVDEEGLVTLTWDHSASKDNQGYFVYFANDPNAEFSILNKSIVKENVFYDTLALKTVSEEVYYIVKAQDKSFNKSVSSNLFKLKRPDVLPPIAPTLRQLTHRDTTLHLTWIKSTSTDVLSYEISRRKVLGKTQQPWVVIDTVPVTVSEYFDRSVELNQLYEYTVQAKDDAALLSEYSNIGNGSVPIAPEHLGVPELQVNYDAETGVSKLVWSYSIPSNIPENLRDGLKIQLYKAYGSKAVEAWKVMDFHVTEWTDSDLKPGSIVTYGARVVSSTGLSGVMCPTQGIRTE
ncbi:MAG: hypothetical protein ACFB10_13385 [Salibacteraceae bacterium]